MVVLWGELSEGISTERPARKTRAVPVCSTVAVATFAATEYVASSSISFAVSAISADSAAVWSAIIALAILGAPCGLAAYIGARNTGGVYTFRYQGSNSGSTAARLGRAVESERPTFSQCSPVDCCTTPT